MKHLMIPAILVLMILAVVNATALQISSVKLGDDKTERGKNITATFTITNDAAFNITNVQISTTATSDKNITFSGAPVNLTAGQSATVSMTGKIPLNLDAVDKNFESKPVIIGTMTATAQGSGQTVTSNVVNIEMQAENRLSINDLTFFINGESERTSNNDKIDGIKPGDKLSLEVQLKNKFSDNTDKDLDIEDVQVNIHIDDSDFDVDEDEDVGDLGPKDEDQVSFDFDVDTDVDDGTYKLIITTSGRDTNGALHGEKNELRLKIERNTHDITIRQAGISPSTLVCGENSVRFSTTISNFGRRDEKAAAIEVIAPQLRMNKKVIDIAIDEDRSRTESFDLTVPEGTKPGSYRLDVNTYFDNVAKSNSKSVTLVVEPCEEETEEEETTPEESKESPVVVTQPPQIVLPPAPTVRVVPPTIKDSFKDSTTYLILLAGISGLILMIIMALVVVFVVFRRR